MTSRHAACLLATVIVLGLGVGAALVQSAAVTVESEKIAVADLGLTGICAVLQARQLDRAHSIDHLLRMSTQDVNFDSYIWNDYVRKLGEQNQQINDSLAAAGDLIHEYSEVWKDYENLGDYLSVVREKSDRLESEAASLVRLANEGRLDEVRALGPYMQLEAEVVRHQIAAFSESVRMSTEHSTRTIQLLAAQQLLGWMVVSGLLLVCVGWLIGKEGAMQNANTPTAKRKSSVEPPRASASSSQLNGCHVLIAEDGAANQRMLSTTLQNAGARVEMARDGQEAWERVGEMQRKGIPFDVIVTDIQMPVMDGLQLTRKLRDHDFPGGIIALTGQAADDLRDRCFEVGCDAFLTKPIGREELIAAVHRQVKRHSTQRA